jgi:hypothetical protein
MKIRETLCVSIMFITLGALLWNHRFDIRYWWEGLKAARRLYPRPEDAFRRAGFAKRYALDQHARGIGKEKRGN